MCTQAQNISSESGSVQDQPCEDPFKYGDTLYVYISTASDNCNGWQDPSGDDDGYPLTLPPAPVTTTTTEPYSPPVTEAPAPVTTTTTEPAPVPTTPSVLTPSSSPCSENDPFIVDYQALQAEVQRATAQLDVLERQLDQVRGDVTLMPAREREASQLAEIAIPEQKKSIAKLESGLERMAPTVEQIKADSAGQSAQGEGTDLPAGTWAMGRYWLSSGRRASPSCPGSSTSSPEPFTGPSIISRPSPVVSARCRTPARPRSSSSVAAMS